ncbi:MAG: hypothetical protein KKA76_02960, partial [Proteobacteria bacterium]|nr:hypothetical protein [Pseudomonadota bacterium]
MIRDHRFVKDFTFVSFSPQFFFRILVFSTVWFVLTGSDISSWIVGVPAVLIASKLNLMLAPSSHY